jgi:hypothetical protein
MLTLGGMGTGVGGGFLGHVHPLPHCWQPVALRWNMMTARRSPSSGFYYETKKQQTKNENKMQKKTKATSSTQPIIHVHQ